MKKTILAVGGAGLVSMAIGAGVTVVAKNKEREKLLRIIRGLTKDYLEARKDADIRTEFFYSLEEEYHSLEDERNAYKKACVRKEQIINRLTEEINAMNIAKKKEQKADENKEKGVTQGEALAKSNVTKTTTQNNTHTKTPDKKAKTSSVTK